MTLDLDDEAAAAFREGVASGALPTSLNLDPQTVGTDLAKLLLTLMEFVRQLLEAQAKAKAGN